MLLHDIQNNQTTQIAKIWNSKFAGALVKMSFFTLPDYGCIYSMIENLLFITNMNIPIKSIQYPVQTCICFNVNTEHLISRKFQNLATFYYDHKPN